MKLNKQHRFLALFIAAASLGLTPLACGGDDDDDGTGGASGSGGSSGSGGKANSGGTSGSSNEAGAPSEGGASGGSGGSAGSGTAGASAGESGGGGEGGGEIGGAGGAGGEANVPQARVRVVHASPSAPAVDIYAAGTDTLLATDVGYGDATPFLEVDEGTWAFDLRPTGALPSSEPAVTTNEVEVAGGEDYTLVAAGDFSALDDEDVGFRLLPFEHDFAVPTAGHAIARVVHATPAWQSVDVDLSATAGVELTGLVAFADEDDVSLPIAAETISFSSEGEALSTLNLPALTAGSELFVIATGNPGQPFRAPANGFSLLVVNQDGVTSFVKEQPWIHVLHASDIGDVDVYNAAATAVGARLVNDQQPATLSAFQLPISTAGYTLKALASSAVDGAGTGIAQGSTSTLTAGDHFLSYIAGSEIFTIREQFDLTKPAQVVLRAVHAAPGVSASVDVGPFTGTALGTPFVQNLAPETASAEAGVAAVAPLLTLAVTATGTTTPLLASRTLTETTSLKAAERDFVLVVDAAQPLWVVDTSVAGWSVR